MLTQLLLNAESITMRLARILGYTHTRPCGIGVYHL